MEALLEDGFNLLHPVVIHNITISCSLESKIIELQQTDVGISHIKRKMQEQEAKHFRLIDMKTRCQEAIVLSDELNQI